MKCEICGGSQWEHVIMNGEVLWCNGTGEIKEKV